MLHWSAFPGACFSGLSDVLEYLDGVIGQVPTWLEITQLARELGHQLATICDI